MKRTLSRASGAALLALVSLLVLIPLAGQAQVPQTISYQGSLTDSSGAPVTAPVAMTFRLWDAPDPVGATLLWQETQASVSVTNGAFDVLLGADAGNPLGQTLFENPLYLGIAVGGDPEMVPRQALAAAGYGLRAKTVEVDSLNALSCGTGEVAKWDGAAWACAADVDTDTDTLYVAGAGLTLSATTFAVDTSGITGAMIAPGAVAEGKLGFDTATQAELDTAVATIGPHVTSVDGLTGGAISSGVSVTGTVSATDVAVSSTSLVTNLNADRLDGLQAAEIVAAAQDEVRTPISTLPFTISASGSYYLTGDLSLADTAANGLTVNADNVTIDLMGFSLIGPGAGTGDGISGASRSNVEVRNGTVRGFGGSGVSLLQVPGADPGGRHRMIALRVLANGGAGIVLVGPGLRVKDCIATDNGDLGIVADIGVGATIVGNSAYGNQSFGIVAAAGATVTGNTAASNAFQGIRVGDSSTVTGNTAQRLIPLVPVVSTCCRLWGVGALRRGAGIGRRRVAIVVG